jgi:hypothetical protein
MQLFNYLFGWHLTVKQFDQLVLQRVKCNSPIDLLAALSFRTVSDQLSLSGLNQYGLQVAEQQGRMKILEHGLGGLAAKVLQVQSTLEHAIKGLMGPAVMIHFQKLLRGIRLLVQQGGHQHFQLTRWQTHTDKSDRQLQRQSQFSQLRSLFRPCHQPNDLAAPGSIPAKHLLCGCKVGRRAARNVMQAQPMVPSQVAVTSKTTVIDQNISSLGFTLLLDRHVHLAQTAGLQTPIQSNPVKQVIEH